MGKFNNMTNFMIEYLSAPFRQHLRPDLFPTKTPDRYRHPIEKERDKQAQLNLEIVSEMDIHGDNYSIERRREQITDSRNL